MLLLDNRNRLLLDGWTRLDNQNRLLLDGWTRLLLDNCRLDKAAVEWAAVDWLDQSAVVR